jgi:hypothetical protein
LCGEFLFVKLPIFVDGYGFPPVDKRFYMRYERLSPSCHIAFDIFAAIGSIVLILGNF